MDIEVKGLTKSYEDKLVLDGFDAVFPEGSITCIMGGSGCGKTTLLNIMLGFLKADAGTIAGLPEHIGVVFQEDRLCESHSAVSNVRLVTGERYTKDEIAQELVSLDIAAEDVNKPVSEFSGGMKRRVAIARAFLYECDLLVLDEAFKGLDGDTKMLVMKWAKQHADGRTIISVTHDLQEAEFFGERLIRMEKK